MELVDTESKEKTVQKVGKTSSAFAQNEYIEQNKARIVTDEEYARLKDYSDLLGIKLYKAIKAVKKEDENKQTVYRFTGFKKTEAGQIAEMTLAIDHFYGRLSTERIFFDKAGRTHVLSINQVDEAKSFLADNWRKSESTTAPQKITTYIQNRWNDSDFSINRYYSLVMSFFQDSYLCIDPFMKAVELRAQEIKSGKVNAVTFDKFCDELSKSINTPDYEPYRKKALHLLLRAPLIIRCKHYWGQGMQNMVIFVGKQGVGKSTLCNVIALGFKDDLEDVSAVDQATAIKRATNVVLENAELSSFSKAEIEKVKSAITRRAISILLKYQNTETKFDCVAMLIGTTNDYDFLKDLTGERRFLPIKLEKWDNQVVTYDFMLSAYATEYLNLFENNKNYQYIQQLEDDIENKKQSLLRAGNSNQASELKQELADLETDFDTYLQAFNHKYLSLNVPETSEDLEYKRENYGQADKQLDLVRKVFQEAYDNPSSLIAAQIIRVRKDSFVGLVPKQQLDKYVTAYVEQHFNGKSIYGNKASKWALTHGKPTQVWDKTKNVKVIKIDKEEFNKMLDSTF